MLGGLMWILVLTLIFLSIATWVFHVNTLMHNCIIALCIVVLGIFMIYDTQLIVGKGRHRLSLDDYIIAALILYLDIITIFLYLLDLLKDK